MNQPVRRIQNLNLTLSQGSLQDFVDCRRRFYLRYVLRLAWPAIESEPILEQERYMQQGVRFHKMVQQYLVGINHDKLAAQIHEPDLQRWWNHFLSSLNIPPLNNLKNASGQCHPELSLSAPIGDARLGAKCDLVWIGSGSEVVIYDWKTSRHRPTRVWLAERLQTHVYPYLLARSAQQLNQVSSNHTGKPFHPEQIKMLYWFADFPEQPEIFTYTTEKFLADERYLTGLMDEIQDLGDSEFEMTIHEDRCKFCVYRSLCSRGMEAGSFDDCETSLETGAKDAFFIDFENIPEIEL